MDRAAARARTGPQGRTARWLAAHVRGGDDGQVAITLVLGVVLIMVLGTTILVTQTVQNFPIIQNNLAQHYAYRAVEAGLNEYEYQIDTNPNLVLCNTSNLNTRQCQALQPFKFGQWNQVPNSGLGGSPTEYFSVYPSIDIADGLVKAVIDGAAYATGGYAYQYASVAFQPTNSFLLHDWWSVHGIIDPATVNSSCTLNAAAEKNTNLSLLWGNGVNGANAYSGACQSDLAWSALGTLFNGPVFSDDPLMVCNFGQPINLSSPSGSVDIGTSSPWLGITTADPTDALSNQGCGGASPSSFTNYNVASTLLGQPQSRPPDAVSAVNSLASVAKEDGCLYSGPTSITFDGTNGIIVSSPNTPTSGGKDTNNDLLKNANQCIPSSPGAPIPIPDDGVIVVQAGTPSCTTTPIVGSYFGQSTTQSAINCEGDAIVGNENYDPTTYTNNVGLRGSLTVAAANDVLIDNSITYDDCAGSVPGNNGASSCQISTTANDILGLIAGNFVELNHPAGASVCPTGAGGLNCQLSNPRLDAVVLALQHDFAVNNYGSDSPRGTIALDGSMDQYFADIEGTASSGGGPQTGYLNAYNWDQRLNIISPPYFLTPGTKAWAVASLSVNTSGKSAFAPAALP